MQYLWFTLCLGELNLIAALKAGGEIFSNFHLAGGIQSLLFVSGGSSDLVSLPFIPVTIGDTDAHFSLSVSPPFSATDVGFSFGDMYWFSLCGNLRIDKGLSFIFVEKVSLIPGYEKKPVLFLTARVGTEGKFTGLSMGAIDYITKPFSFQELEKMQCAQLA